jgi:hypothetical protein
LHFFGARGKCYKHFYSRNDSRHLLHVSILRPGDNDVKLFTSVIYDHSMVTQSFCVIKLYYLGNYHEMAVNYNGILTLEKVGLKFLQ